MYSHMHSFPTFKFKTRHYLVNTIGLKYFISLVIEAQVLYFPRPPPPTPYTVKIPYNLDHPVKIHTENPKFFLGASRPKALLFPSIKYFLPFDCFEIWTTQSKYILKNLIFLGRFAPPNSPIPIHKICITKKFNLH